MKEDIRVTWENFCHDHSLNPERVITKNSILCSLHFEESCFVKNNSRKLLLRNARPTITVSSIKGVIINYEILVCKSLV